MSLEDSVKEAVMKQIGCRSVYSLESYAEVNYKTIAVLYGSGIINDKDLDKALESAVVNTAVSDFSLILNKGYWPCHVGMPECLSYAISNGILSADDVKKIKFDHGQTADDFCKEFSSDGLLPKLREKFFNPKNSSECGPSCRCC